MLKPVLAALKADVPELPSFITLFYNRFKENSFVDFLHHYQTSIYSILIALVIILIFTLAARKRQMVPGAFQNAVEFFVDSFRHAIVSVLGSKGEKYVPFLGTLFIYILFMNLAGLIPFMLSPSANLNTTIGLAICVFCLVQYLNIKHMGVGGFLYHMAGEPKNALGWGMSPLLFFTELLNQVSRPVTLSLRLFGNILGEDILIGAFALFGVAIIGLHNSPVGIPLQIPAMFMSLLFSFMQALVFTLLSTVYILLAIQHTDEQHH